MFYDEKIAIVNFSVVDPGDLGFWKYS